MDTETKSTLKPPLEGVRVLRGPDWRNDDDVDGGEGHLGTVQGLVRDGMVRVLWDIGQESTCRTGLEGKFDLRIFDTATVGVRHEGTSCTACGERDIGGMLWRCQQCADCPLCSLCYADDQHDLRHRFLRIDLPGAPGTPMKKRNVSVRIRAMGLFPGAKVSRGKDWQWKDQDGGAGSEGEVLEIINTAKAQGKRNLIKVQWPSGKANVYRLGHKGHVDVTCTDEEAGGFYYRDHLPCLDTYQFSHQGMKVPAPEDVTATPEPADARDTTMACAGEAHAPSLIANTPDTAEDEQSTLKSPADDAALPGLSAKSASTGDNLAGTEPSSGLPAAEEMKRSTTGLKGSSEDHAGSPDVNPSVSGRQNGPGSPEAIAIQASPGAADDQNMGRFEDVTPGVCADTPTEHSIEHPTARDMTGSDSSGVECPESTGDIEAADVPREPSLEEGKSDSETLSSVQRFNSPDCGGAEAGELTTPQKRPDDHLQLQEASEVGLSDRNHETQVDEDDGTENDVDDGDEKRTAETDVTKETDRPVSADLTGTMPVPDSRLDAAIFTPAFAGTLSQESSQQTAGTDCPARGEQITDHCQDTLSTQNSSTLCKQAVEDTAAGGSDLATAGTLDEKVDTIEKKMGSEVTLTPENVNGNQARGMEDVDDNRGSCQKALEERAHEQHTGTHTGAYTEDCILPTAPASSVEASVPVSSTDASASNDLTGAVLTKSPKGRLIPPEKAAGIMSAESTAQPPETLTPRDSQQKTLDSRNSCSQETRATEPSDGEVWSQRPMKGLQTPSLPAPQTQTNKEAASDATTETSFPEVTTQRRSPPPLFSESKSEKMASCQVLSTADESSDQKLGSVTGATMAASSQAPRPFPLLEEMGATGWSGEIRHESEAGGRGSGMVGGGGEGVFVAGQKAVIGVPAHTLKELQAQYGGVTHTMIRKIGREGTVAKVLPSGAVHFRLGKVVFRLNPAALVKTYAHSTGDTVRIRDDLYLLRVLNERLGWRSSMDQTVGKVGEVTRVDDDGDLRVQFGARSYMYSPACCVPAPGCVVDILSERGGGSARGLANSLIDSAGLGGSAWHERLSDLLSIGGRGGVGGGGGGRGHRIRLRDLAQMSDLGDLSEQLSQLTGGSRVGLTLGEKKTPEGQLQKAVLASDVDKVKELCRADPALIERVHGGLTPLMLASHQGKRKVLLALLELGANVNATGQKDQTALITALDEKEEEMALVLLEHGADVRQKNGKDRTPLHSAVFNHQNEAAQILLHMGADVNAQDKYGDTPLHDGIARQNVVMVDLLLQMEGVNVRLVNRNGHTPLYLACRVENAQIVGLLLAVDSSNVNQLKEQDLAPLHICVRERFLEGVRLLLANGNADVNLPTGRHGLSALHMACLQASADIVRVLLEMGADVNVLECNGETPLHLAIGGNDGRSTSLQEREADIQTRIEIASLLITHGAIVDAENRKGRTPTTYGHAEVRVGVMQFIEHNPGVARYRTTKQRSPEVRGSGQSALLTSLRGVSTCCQLCGRDCDIILRPCGHQSVCRACAKVVRYCPLCGSEVQWIETDGSQGVTASPVTDPENNVSSEGKASLAEPSSTDTKDPDLSFSMNNKAMDSGAEERGASRAIQEQTRSPGPLQPKHREAKQLQPNHHPAPTGSSTSEKAADLNSLNQDQEQTRPSVARTDEAEAHTGDDHILTVGSQASGAEREKTFDPSSPDNKLTSETSGTAESSYPASMDSPAKLCKPSAVDPGQNAGDKRSVAEDLHPKQSVHSSVQSPEKATTAVFIHVGEAHEENGEPEGTLPRASPCRLSPAEAKRDSVEPSKERAESGNEADVNLASTGYTDYFADDKLCPSQSALDNRALTLKTEARADAGVVHGAPGVDGAEEDLELPDLPSVPAWGTGFGDWVATGPEGPVSLSDPQRPPPAGFWGSDSPDRPATGKSSPGGQEPQFNPWLKPDKQKEFSAVVGTGDRGSKSRRDIRKEEESPESQVRVYALDRSDVSKVQMEKESMPSPVQLYSSRRDLSEKIQRSAHESLNDRGNSDRLPMQAESGQTTYSSQGLETEERARYGRAAVIERLTDSDDQQGDTGDKKLTPHAPQDRNQIGPCATEETNTAGDSDSQRQETAGADHDAAEKMEENNGDLGIMHAANRVEESPHHPRTMATASRDRTDPESSTTATALITQRDLKKPKDTILNISSFAKFETCLQADNLSAIFQSMAGSGTQRTSVNNDGISALPDRGAVSLTSQALSAADSERGGREATATGQSHYPAQDRRTTEPHSYQRHLSASDSSLSVTPRVDSQGQPQPGTGVSRQKSRSEESVQSSKRGHRAGPPESDPRQPDMGQGSALTPQGAVSQNAEQRKPTTSGREQTLNNEEELSAGDRAVIKVSEETLVSLQQAFGGTTKGMLQCLGKTGVVTDRTKRGAVCVKFNSPAYRFNPRALMRVHVHNVGDTVRVRADLELVKLLNKSVGFCAGIVETLDSVGTVTNIDREGDLTVSFGQSSFQYSPACCVPAPGTTPDNISGGRGASAENSSGGSFDERSAERQAHMQKLARMVKEGVSIGHVTRSPGSDSSAISRLFEAIKDGNLTLIREMCQSDPSLVGRAHEGRELTPLMYASWKGQVPAVRLLLDLGADVNGRLPLSPGMDPRLHSRVPLTAALESKEEETAVLLLERGADPRCGTAHCRTALHMAATRNLVQVTQVLLNVGVDVNAKDKYGDTPLMDALVHDSRAVAEILLHVPDLDVTLTNAKGNTPLHFSCHKNNQSAVQEILTRDISRVNTRMDSGYAPLHLAVDRDSPEIIRLLALIGSADVNLPVGGSEQHASDSPLHIACYKGYTACVEALLDFGADVNVVNNDGDTPLHYAMGGHVPRAVARQAEFQYQEGRVRIACTLISNGAFVDAENNKGRTCMRYGGPEIVGAVQDFMDRNRPLVRKKGARGGQAASDGTSPPVLVLRGAAGPCRLCQDRKSDVTLLPCGHKVVCVTCAERAASCPLCQRRVDSTTLDDQKAALFEAIT